MLNLRGTSCLSRCLGSRLQQKRDCHQLKIHPAIAANWEIGSFHIIAWDIQTLTLRSFTVSPSHQFWCQRTLQWVAPKAREEEKEEEMMMVEEGRSDKEPTLGHTMTVSGAACLPCWIPWLEACSWPDSFWNYWQRSTAMAKATNHHHQPHLYDFPFSWE